MNKYIVYYRMHDNMEWSDEYYPEPFILANNAVEAMKRAKDYILEQGYNIDDYDYMVMNYE